MFLSFVVSCLLILTGCANSYGHYNKQVALFIFGDSIFDPGNNNYINTTKGVQANYWPYGESYFYPPSGRFSDGRIIPDFIGEFAGLPLIPAYLDPHNNEFMYGANFASAASGALNETNSRFNIINLKTQLQYFTELVKHYRKELGYAKAQQLLSDAVYLFSIGANDYEILLENNIPNNIYYEQYVGMVIGNLTDVFMAIHREGGRKFGTIMLNQLGCVLSNRAIQPDNSCDEVRNNLSSLHDNALSKKLHELAQQFEGFMYTKFEFHIEVIKRMERPSKYGFKVGDKACCAANRQLAELFWSGDSKVTSPCNLEALFQDTCVVISDHHSKQK